MDRFVLLLRGINVGKARRIAMADLRALLADAGYTDVKTLLNSGNVVLTGAVDVPRIEKAIHAATGHTVPCVTRTAEEITTILDGHPLADVADDGSRMMVHVLGADPGKAAVKKALALDPERARPGPGVLYQWCPDGLLKAPEITKGIGVLVTSRNWNTLTKLAALL